MKQEIDTSSNDGEGHCPYSGFLPFLSIATCVMLASGRLWGSSEAVSSLYTAFWVDFTYLVAVGALLFPSRKLFQWSLPVCVIVEVVSRLPAAPNHRIVMALGAGLFLVCLAKNVRASILGDSVRALLVIVYAFATFAKLNLAFLDPEVSCANQFFHNVPIFFPEFSLFLPFESVLPVFTIASELLLVLLLLSRRTVRFAALLGALFHLCLALDLVKGFINFSSVMSCWLLIAAYSADQGEGLESSGNRRMRFIPMSLPLRLALATVLVLLAATRISIDIPGSYQFVGQYVFVRYLAYFILCFSIPYELLGRQGHTFWYQKGGKESAGFALILILLIALVNGLSPYLGFKNRSSFSMYSNLRVESGYSNHLLISKSLDVFGFLGSTAGDGGELTFEWCRRRKNLESEQCLFYRTWSGKLAHKFFHFQPVGEAVGRQCIW